MRDLLVALYPDGSREIIPEILRSTAERSDAVVRSFHIDDPITVRAKSAEWEEVNHLVLPGRVPIQAVGRIRITIDVGGLRRYLAHVSMGVGTPAGFTRQLRPVAWIEARRGESVALAARVAQDLPALEVERLLHLAPSSDSLLAVPIVGQRRSFLPPRPRGVLR